MRKRRTNRNEAVEAVLRGDSPSGDHDLGDVAAFVGELRSTYQEGPDPVRNPDLQAFMEAPGLEAQAVMQPTWRQRLERRRIRMLSGLSGFLATVTGKVVLTGAVAAASVGGLHAGDVVDVPGLPDNDPPAVEQAQNGNDENGVDAQNNNGPSTEGEEPDHAVALRTAAHEFAAAIDEYTDCVSDNAKEQGDENTRTTGEFDPRDGCDRPDPDEFFPTDGGVDPASQNSEGAENSENGENGAEGTPGEDNVPDDPTTQGDDDPQSTGDDDDAEGASENGSTGTDTADDFQP